MLLVSVLVGLSACGSAAPTGQNEVALSELASSWARDYTMRGTHSLPTWVEEVSLTRSGDTFTLVGGAPSGYEQHTEVLEVADADAQRPAGFLASASLLAAARGGALDGVTVVPQPYGTRRVACVDAELVGLSDALLDPCADVVTGAVIAMRHRATGMFDGPSLDPYSVSFSASPTVVSNPGSP